MISSQSWLIDNRTVSTVFWVNFIQPWPIPFSYIAPHFCVQRPRARQDSQSGKEATLKISSSQIAFLSESQKNTSSSELELSHRSERLLNSNQRPEMGSAASSSTVELSYAARMRSEQSSHSQSLSSVTQAGKVVEHQRNTNLSSIVSTVIGKEATVEKSTPLLDLRAQLTIGNQQNLAVGLYSSIDQITAASPSDSPMVQVNGQQIQLEDQAIQITANNLSLAEVNIPRELDSILETRVDISKTHLHKETEQMQFSSHGILKTEDGREINFMLELEMARDFELEETFELHKTERQRIDPLVINLQGGSASLTSTSFTFDLNADGLDEKISFVSGGSGFLALDINNDGQINDGSELFGTQGTSAFADLARHDSDGNKWIDENDEIFNDLKVWTRDEAGNDQLTSLKDSGVGAIYLGSSASTFDLKDDENNLLGSIKRSGVFLSENGQVASVQELDLAIHAAQRAPDKHGIAISGGGPVTNLSPLISTSDTGQIANTPPGMIDAKMVELPDFIDQRESTSTLNSVYDRAVARESAPDPVTTVQSVDWALQPVAGAPAGTIIGEATFGEAITLGGASPDVEKSAVKVTAGLFSEHNSQSTTVTTKPADELVDETEETPEEAVKIFYFDEHKLDLFHNLNMSTEKQTAEQESSLAIMRETILQLRTAAQSREER